MKHVSFDNAKTLETIGFDEYTHYLYMKTRIGIKVVKGDLEKHESERIYHEGDLYLRDKDWGIDYPSTHWIPAPYVYQVINWFDRFYNIQIIPIFNNEAKTWGYNVEFPDLLNFIKTDIKSDKSFYKLEDSFHAAIYHICLIAEENNWKQKLLDNLWKPMKIDNKNISINNEDNNSAE